MKLKRNVLMIIIMIFCVISMFFTLNHANVNHTPSNGFEQNLQMPGNMQPGGNNFPGNMQGNFQGQMPSNMQGNGFQGQMPGNMQGNFQDQMQNIQGMNQNNKSLSTMHVVLLVVEGAIFSICLIYLFMSKFNSLSIKETFINSDKVLICVLSTILMSEVTLGVNVLIYNNLFHPIQLLEEDDEEYEEIDEGVIVNDSVIDLSQYDSNITLKESKEYTLTGKFNHSVLIDAAEEVIVKLDNVTISSNHTAAIANINTNDFTVYLIEGSVNHLSDGGNSEYDGCLYSNGVLTIDGSGTLYVNGNQEEGEGIATTDQDIIINNGNIHVESNDDGLNAGGDNGGMITVNNGSVYVHASGDGIDSNGGLTINGGYVYSMGSAAGGDAGIDTDKGYSIHGGTVIGLGSDMLTPPSNDSKQLSISLNMETVIEKGDTVSLMKGEEEIITFEVDENFRTLVLSSSKLEKGTYEIHVNNEKIMDIEL